MRIRNVPASSVALLAASALAIASPASATTTADGAAADEAIIIQSAGFAALMPDERDAVLQRVLALLPDRLLELSGELPDFPALPEPMVRALAAGIGGPMTMSFDIGDVPAGGGPPDFRAQLSMQPDDPAVATQLTEMLMGMASEQGISFAPSGVPGLGQTDAPFGTLVAGVRAIDGRPTFVLGANTRGDTMPRVVDHRLPAGVEPAFAMQFDTRRLGPIFEEMMAAQGADPAMMPMMAMLGVGGETGVSGTMAFGYDADRAHTMVVLRDYAEVAGVVVRMGVARPVTIPVAEFRAIPRDAVLVNVSSGSLGSIVNGIDMMAASAGAPPNFWDELAEPLGFHPRTDLLDHLGDTLTVYRSDATGGGGMMSAVALIGLADADRIARTHATLVERFNAEVSPQAQGYVSIRPWRAEGHDLFTLSFNGVPVPLQITWGIQDQRLVVAASPTAVLAAMRQAGGAGGAEGSFADRAEVVAMTGGSLEGLVSFSYVDTPRAAAKGYGTATLLSTALANMVRSPRPEARDRDAGVPMPSYARFTQGIVPTVSVGRWVGDDFVTHLQSDRSMLVSMAGAFDAAGGLAAVGVAAMAVGALQPAIVQAREAAEATQSMAQLRTLSVAIAMYGADRDGRMPDSLDDLIADAFITPESLGSPFGPSIDGGPDFGYRTPPSEGGFDPSTTMVILDRAMLWSKDITTVAFADGHVEQVTYEDLDRLLRMPENRGAASDLGIQELVQWMDLP